MCFLQEPLRLSEKTQEERKTVSQKNDSKNTEEEEEVHEV